MKNIKLPYRYDYVGSFLRPDDLKKIRADYEAGKTTYEALKEAEDTAIRDLVAKQKAAGYKLLTDGEFRRKTWYLDFMWGFEGVSHSAPRGGIPFHDVLAVVDDTYLTGKLKLTGTHPFVEHFRFVQALEDENTVAKQTIPSPAQFYEQMIFPMNAETTNKIYPNREELLEDVAKIYRAFIKQLYDAGCRNLQLDDCSWGVCVDPAAPFVFGVEPEKMGDIMDQLLKVNNLALEGKPDDLTVATHICRGNYNSSWASRGGYEPVAERLFAHENVDAYYLEFDDARSGGFEPLRFVTPGKKVVLGLITSKRPELEDKDAVIARIHEAAKYVPLENLCLSPQCGFASCEVGNKLTEEQQWAKLALVKEIAEEVWSK